MLPYPLFWSQSYIFLSDDVKYLLFPFDFPYFCFKLGQVEFLHIAYICAQISIKSAKYPILEVSDRFVQKGKSLSK
jgi:hypothetical protein